MGNEIRDNDPGNVFQPICCMPYTFSSVCNSSGCHTLYLIYVHIKPSKNADVSVTHTEKPEGEAY